MQITWTPLFPPLFLIDTKFLKKQGSHKKLCHKEKKGTKRMMPLMAGDHTALGPCSYRRRGSSP